MIEAIELTSTRRSRGPGGPVEKVSFDVYPGQVTALLGAPGAGKSTVLRMMVELEPADGRTLFGGRPYHALRPAVREVGLALNPDAMHPGRTVQAHLQLYSAAGGVPKARLAEVLEITGLSTQSAVRCGRLDAGQRQRLAIAAALLGDPSALILDEPHALDGHGMSWFHALIRAYAAQGRTVLVAATDPDSLAGTADHVVVLRRDEEDGVSRVIASRSAAEVFDEHRAIVVQVRSPQAARLAAALEAEGARLSAAGPGALQVRGLDRARIGEVAHVAGICLHELSEIGHDDDVFGLRPVPRQKDLLPGLTAVVAEGPAPATAWNSGVRLVSTGTPPREIEEAEVVEPSPETAVAVAEVRGEAPVADGHGPAGVPEQPASQQPAERQNAGRVESDQSSAEVGQMQVSAEVSCSQDTATHAEAAVVGRAVSDQSVASPETAYWRQAAEVTLRTADRPLGVAATDADPVAGGAVFAGVEAGDASIRQTTVPGAPTGPSQAAGAIPTPPLASSTPVPAKPPTTLPSSKRTANRAFGTFRRGRGKVTAEAVEEPTVILVASSAPSQPAVPFTVAAEPAPVVAGEGMTPWRAVAARAAQQHEQVPVVEAASAEQEASA
ncbi:MAG: ATP-binding cassette domain-containing protein [Catenulispora sp.]|nr:ATP-binding cassette domain-containing protein [Catenulispora sp.]